ncbi:hypothetical protein [Rhizorhabdus histidinilytica]|uniref:hypothetical protein n=1 Tax=Rhizorhabdus histidinilytica TaxID=439228 RepID=UPI00322019DA
MSMVMCATCRFWEPSGFGTREYGEGPPDEGTCAEEIGSCHRAPPTIVPLPVRRAQGTATLSEGEEGYAPLLIRNHTAWPSTLTTETCGKWAEHPREAHRRRAEMAPTPRAVRPDPFAGADQDDDRPF